MSKHHAGCMRVRTKRQDTASQEPELKCWAQSQEGDSSWYHDSHTGTSMDRPGFRQLIKDMETGQVDMRLPRAGFTVRRMMISVGILAVLLALHAPVLRDVMRHELLNKNSEFRSNPARVARENYIFSLNTVPTLLVLGMFDVLLALACWRRSRDFIKSFLNGGLQFLITERR